VRSKIYARLPRSMFEPLRITARLQCGVVSDGNLPIDSILYSMAHREEFGGQTMTLPGTSQTADGSNAALPLMRVAEESPMWFYAASFAQWPEAQAEGKDYWNTRLDLSLVHLVDFGKRRGSVDVAAGRYKAYHMPVFYRHALAIEWYVVGHSESIERLLSCCTNIGKKTSQGWGAVSEWRVEPTVNDWSVRGDGGRPMRAIPDGKGVLHGFRPSYWLPQNQTRCEMP
jgi:CRISPR type IV-associated protein Csf3